MLPILFAVTMMTAMAWDVVTLEIPDALSLFVAGTAVIGLALAGEGWTSHGTVALVLFLFGAGLFFLGVWGGGDVKFMTATGLWLDWADLPFYLLAVCLAGGVLALLLLILREMTWSSNRWMPQWLIRLCTPGEGIPYGVALGTGGLLSHGQIASFLSAFP